MLCSLLLI